MLVSSTVGVLAFVLQKTTFQRKSTLCCLNTYTQAVKQPQPKAAAADTQRCIRYGETGAELEDTRRELRQPGAGQDARPEPAGTTPPPRRPHLKQAHPGPSPEAQAPEELPPRPLSAAPSAVRRSWKHRPRASRTTSCLTPANAAAAAACAPCPRPPALTGRSTEARGDNARALTAPRRQK